jgi:hypothetical protein
MCPESDARKLLRTAVQLPFLLQLTFSGLKIFLSR